MNRPLAVGGALLALFALAGCGGGQMADKGEPRLMATLSGAQEVPPVNTNGSGTTRLWYNPGTKTLSWVVEYQGLSSPLTAAHFHGPAAPGSNAGVQIPIVAKGPVNSPVSGAAMLTAAQEADLMAGRYYVNLHTERNPAGELRGQVTAAQ